MRTLNLSGFKPSDSLSISVSQGALTAGPINVPSWGGGGDGGTITIQTHRSHMEVAPDSVRFWVDLSASTFDTAGPASGHVYDARLHDLIYLWDFDDPGTWTAPENALPAWKDRNTAKGPFVMHMYPDAGTYSPSVLVIEPSSGKTATATLSGGEAITVLDPDDVYPGAATILVNEIGDDDWTYADTHYPTATRVNSGGLQSNQAPWTTHTGGAAKRWLFKRGGYFEQRLQLGDTTTPGVYFGAYGTGDKPKIANAPYFKEPGDPLYALVNEVPFGAASYYGQGMVGGVPDLRIVDLHGYGTYNPITTRSDYRPAGAKPGVWMFNIGNNNLIMHECEFSGLQGSNLYCGGNYQLNYDKEITLHFNHCTMTAFGGDYPIFTGQSNNARSAVGVTGCRLTQTPGAVSDDEQRSGSTRAIIRAQNPHRFHMRGCDMYLTDYWQPCAKVIETPSEHGNIVNIHSSSMEGGFGALFFNNNWSQAVLGGNSHVHNIVVDGLAIFSNYSTQFPFKVQCTGVTIRNTLLVTPSVDRYGENQNGFITVYTRGTFDADVVGAAPIRLVNNTYAFEKTPANAVGWAEPAEMVHYLEEGDPYTNIDYLSGNNIIHKPNAADPVTTFAPLSSELLFSHRDQGYRNTDPYFGYIKNSTVTVANGADHVLPYGTLYQTLLPTSQAYFSGSSGYEKVYSNDKIYVAADGDFTVDYGATEVTITNTSGETWNPSYNGSTYWTWFQLDMGTTAPVVPNTAPAAGSWKDFKPLPGSAALGAALTGNVSYMDILGTTRTAPADKGAWEVA